MWLQEMGATKAARHIGLGRSTLYRELALISGIRRTARSGLAGIMGQRTSEPLVGLQQCIEGADRDS